MIDLAIGAILALAVCAAVVAAFAAAGLVAKVLRWVKDD